MPQADVVIMGGGLAGLVAGNRARELGLTAIILEKGTEPDYLCDSRVATGAIHLASTSPKADPETIVAKIVEKTAGFANQDLARALAERAGDAVDWLEANGAEYMHSPTPRFWMMPTRGRQEGLSWEGWVLTLPSSAWQRNSSPAAAKSSSAPPGRIWSSTAASAPASRRAPPTVSRPSRRKRCSLPTAAFRQARS
jgi:glycine/D-amino acid oxidase-like deaminating enzyme